MAGRWALAGLLRAECLAGRLPGGLVLISWGRRRLGGGLGGFGWLVLGPTVVFPKNLNDPRPTSRASPFPSAPLRPGPLAVSRRIPCTPSWIVRASIVQLGHGALADDFDLLEPVLCLQASLSTSLPPAHCDPRPPEHTRTARTSRHAPAPSTTTARVLATAPAATFSAHSHTRERSFHLRCASAA